MLNGLALRRMVISLIETAQQPPGGGGYSIYPWVGRCCAAPHTLTLFKTNITDFPTLFRTEFRFLIPCLSQWKSILINIRACKNFSAYRPRQDILFKTKIDKSIPCLRQKMINSIPCLRQKSRKTYPGWPHVPIKGVPPPPRPPPAAHDSVHNVLVNKKSNALVVFVRLANEV